MKSLDIDSPAPYIALGIVQQSDPEEPPPQPSNLQIFIMSIECILIGFAVFSIWHYYGLVVSFTENPPKFKVVIEHTYEKPDWITPYPDFSDSRWKELDVHIKDWLAKNVEIEEEDPMYVTAYEEDQMYRENEESISDSMYRMCSNIVPLEWNSQWKSDPQLWTGKMRDDFDFCSIIFAGFMDFDN